MKGEYAENMFYFGHPVFIKPTLIVVYRNLEIEIKNNASGVNVVLLARSSLVSCMEGIGQ